MELAEGGQPDEAWVQKMLAEAGPQPENADGDDDDDDGCAACCRLPLPAVPQLGCGPASLPATACMRGE